MALHAIDTIITGAIEQRVFPGAVVLVAQAGEVRHLAGYGSTMYADSGSQPVQPTTIYDIASLTKVFTATVALQLVDAGALALDEPAARYLPDIRARTVTIRHLLSHTSALDLRLSTLRHHDPAALRTAIYAVKPSLTPGTRTAYVNINSLLLGDVVAAVADQPLDVALRQMLLGPLGLRATGFCPPAALHTQIAPSEWDEAWRGGLVCGTVHDESAHALGGVAGHAGLFSTAEDVGRFGQMWLDGGTSAGTRLLRPETVDLATRYQGPWLHLAGDNAAIRCGLGWMLDRSEIMGAAPPGSYGHTGFTGPVLVVVPRHRLVVVVLCNRTYPRRAEHRPFPVVAAVVNAALHALA
jgi:CubicO group peptidase (beta-lactamase class C family)